MTTTLDQTIVTIGISEKAVFIAIHFEKFGNRRKVQSLTPTRAASRPTRSCWKARS
jgi:hypothetical protein